MEKIRSRIESSTTFQQKLEHLPIIRFARSEKWSALLWTDVSDAFQRMYPSIGRPSVAPEKLLRALLLQVLYSIRSERLLREQLAYNILFRWFVGLSMEDEVWDHSTFSKNRDRVDRFCQLSEGCPPPDRSGDAPVAQKGEGFSIDARIARHSGYAICQKARKRVHEIFGWMKTVSGHRKTRYRGIQG